MLNLLVGFSHIIFILPLNVQVEFSAANWGLLTRLHVDSSQRNLAVGLILYSVEEPSVAGLLSGPKGIIVDFKVVGEKIRTLRSVFAVDELID